MAETAPEQVTQAVARLYDTYPFPPDPVLSEAPPGYNWRWSWEAAYGFCTGGLAPSYAPRILDAGCGSGVSTEYLVHLNPQAQVWAVDISAGALDVAQERIRRTAGDRPVTFRQMSLFDLDQPQEGWPAEFDWINSVGVLHHTADPTLALQRLAGRLATGGIIHLFLYAAIGRWEIRLMQEALQLLSPQGFPEGVRLGRELLAALPEQNRLVQRERTRWQLENQRDECFADMYLHPHEVDLTIDSLFAIIEASGLKFAGFSNPEVWQVERLLGQNPELCQRAIALPQQQRYRLIELLDTDIAHYEFFLYKPPLPVLDWQNTPWQQYFPRRNPCLSGWEEGCAFDQDYRVVRLTPEEIDLLRQCDRPDPIAAIAPHCPELWQSLVQRRLVLLAERVSGSNRIAE